MHHIAGYYSSMSMNLKGEVFFSTYGKTGVPPIFRAQVKNSGLFFLEKRDGAHFHQRLISNGNTSFGQLM